MKAGDDPDPSLGAEPGRLVGAAPGGVVDWRVAARLRDDLGAEMAGRILRAAVADLRDAAGRYVAAVRAGETEPARSAAHVLSSVADVIGAGALAARAREAEVTAHAGLPAAPVAEEFERLVEAAAAEVERHLRPGAVD